MRYVTIQNSHFWNNGVGIVPTRWTRRSSRHAEFNVIKDNEIFWNNFNYYLGAPFEIRPDGRRRWRPAGVGILLFGGRDTLVEGNQIYGNYVAGFALIEASCSSRRTRARALVGNTVRGNASA